MSRKNDAINRRRFLKTTAAGVGMAAVGTSLTRGEQAAEPATRPAAQVDPGDLIWRNRNPAMDYRRMGRTNYMVSRIVAGWGGDEALWRRILANGVNYFDTARGYGNLEQDLKPFLARFRDKVWVTSKATDVAGYSRIDAEVVRLYRKAMKDFLGSGEGDLLALHQKAVEKQKATGEKPDLRPVGRHMAGMYATKLDESLRRMGIDHVDCYFYHGVEIPWIFDCPEVWEGYEKVHRAGKVKHFGFSCHRHHKEVLAAAVEANDRGPWRIDLIMPGVNPETFTGLRDELAALKRQDVGIIAMKTSGIRNRPLDGREKKFQALTEGREYNEWERAKLWMLHLTDGLIDGCIAAMKSNEDMERTTQLPTVELTDAARRELRALVKYEMAGACTMCGKCDNACPEHIAITDMIRYHAYVHQYNEKELARQLYAQAGYDPARLCHRCGACADACAAHVPITELLHQLPASLRA